ncbi:PIN domain-containing protein [Synoicihabitans lomoniglobus]|uniref:PIN domain-containing protein n=1 Tax=Synoicihabitans lomoniglobus TaxID=2909285 RepID=A0AAF0CND4_9BACT|nr:PIN domain-containing protein [Opitutaceae bacterium LMO-M01]WED64295.1 PIN domain-containing protein [Opitutaceae bacterium LMO-M01]
MKIVIDTDVWLDVLLDRPSLAEASGAVLAWAADGPGRGVVAWHSVATLDYFLSRSMPTKAHREFLRDLANGFHVSGGDERDLRRALGWRMADFEDAMVAVVAENVGADWIVTRNVKNFRGSPVKAISPEDWGRRRK